MVEAVALYSGSCLDHQAVKCAVLISSGFLVNVFVAESKCRQNVVARTLVFVLRGDC